MKELPELSNVEEREQLIRFLEWTRDLLEELAIGDAGLVPREMYAPPFYSELLVPMSAAWKDVKPLFNDLFEKVRGAKEEALTRHGLRGAQLRFKLATVRRWSRDYLQSQAGRTLRRLLEAIDTLLDSILGAVSFGTAITEFKDAVKDAVQE